MHHMLKHMHTLHSHPAVLNELFASHLLTAEEFPEVAGKESWEWEDHITHVLSTKPAEVLQEACLVLEKHGYPVKKLKSELYTAPYIPCTIVAHFAKFCIKYCIMPT